MIIASSIELSSRFFLHQDGFTLSKWIVSVDSSYSSVILEKRLIHAQEGLVQLRISGKHLSSSKSEFLKNVFQRELDNQNYKLIIDCLKLDMIFSQHMGILLSFCKKFRSNQGDMCFVNVNSSIHAVFERFGLLNYFKIYEDEDAAVENFS